MGRFFVHGFVLNKRFFLMFDEQLFVIKLK